LIEEDEEMQKDAGKLRNAAVVTHEVAQDTDKQSSPLNDHESSNLPITTLLR